MCACYFYYCCSVANYLPNRLLSTDTGTIALSYPPRVRVRATVKLSAVFFHDESSITIGGYESAIAPRYLDARARYISLNTGFLKNISCLMYILIRNNEQFDQNLHHIMCFNAFFNFFLKKWNNNK